MLWLQAADEVLEHALGEESAHAFWVGSRWRCVEAALLVPPDHGLAVVVAAVLWERTDVVAPAVESGPTDLSEVAHGQDVREEPCRLLSVHSRELALVTGD